MTSNRDRAARALYDHRLTVGDFPDGVTEWKDLPDPWKDEWREAADALADAGLLAPDLPEPTWEHMDIWVVDDLEVEAIGDCVYLEWPDETDDMRGTTIRALSLDRRMVLAILAAADYAEEVGTDGQDD